MITIIVLSYICGFILSLTLYARMEEPPYTEDAIVLGLIWPVILPILLVAAVFNIFGVFYKWVRDL